MRRQTSESDMAQDLSEARQTLATMTAYLAKQDAVRDKALAEVDAATERERQSITKEIRILNDAIDDAKRRRRFRIAESLAPKVDEQVYLLGALDAANRRAKLEIHLHHIAATAEYRMDAKRLSNAIETAAAIDRQREMQERRYRKIPVIT